MLPILIGAIAGGALNAFANNTSRQRTNSQIDTYIGTLRDNIISDNDIQSKIRRTTGAYSSNLNNSLNATAFTSRGTINSNVVKASVVSNVEGQRLNAINNIYDKAENFNKNIIDKIGQLETTKDTGNPIADFLGGAVQGGIAGAQINNLLSKPEPPEPGEPTSFKSDFNQNFLSERIRPSLANPMADNPYRKDIPASVVGLTWLQKRSLYGF